MAKSAYDSDDIKLLSAEISKALEIVRKSAPRPLTDSEKADVIKRITDNLMRAFDNGERDHATLGRIALDGVSAPECESGAEDRLSS